MHAKERKKKEKEKAIEAKFEREYFKKAAQELN